MHKYIEIITKYFHNRFIFLIIFATLFAAFNYYFTRSILPILETKNLWFYSGLVMVLFSILFIEPYYTSPKNVLINTIPLLLVLLAINEYFQNLGQIYLWWLFLLFISCILILSIISMTISAKDSSPDSFKNIISKRIKDFVVLLGHGKILYSVVFIYFILNYYPLQSNYVFSMFIVWAFLMCTDSKKLHNNFCFKQDKFNDDAVGIIFGVESSNIFLVKLFNELKNIEKFDVVIFKYSMQHPKNRLLQGIILDIYSLDQEKWIKVIQLDEIANYKGKVEENIVYKISDKQLIDDFNTKIGIGDFVGTVMKDSDVGKIKFEYLSTDNQIQEGDLLELESKGKRLFYQVINGITDIEQLVNKNKSGLIRGEALQLGEWQEDELSFQKYGWVPYMNTPVFLADTSDIKQPEVKYPNYKLGVIPNTTLPSLINLQEAVSHHIALLGVTGSGKSVLARDIINAIKLNTKVICVDFNKEFIRELPSPPISIISDDAVTNISNHIMCINKELVKFPNQQCQKTIENGRKEIMNSIKKEINEFLDANNDNIRVFELPDISNTTSILEYTKYFFKALFEVAQDRLNEQNRVNICVVLEEAHTIIPEWNFIASNDKTSQSIVNEIGQIALQGRKYGIGFIVIAQRTANVSKTVLTQCNTVICFQAFDDTSFNFLGNYIGAELANILPHLKRYHAVVAGKAIKSNMPMIVDLTRNK